MNYKEILSITHDKRIKRDGGYIGYCDSLLNLIREKPIHKLIYSEKTNTSHVFCEPTYKYVDNKQDLIKKLKKIDFSVFIDLNMTCQDFTDYYQIETISGQTFKVLSSKLDNEIKNQINDLMDNFKEGDNASSKQIDQGPILVYNKDIFDNKLRYLLLIKKYIDNKKKRKIYKMFDNNCKLVNNDIVIEGKNYIKKYINNIFGIFNQNIKYYVVAYICGFINNGISDILLNISFFSKVQNNRIDKYVYFTLSELGKISNIKIYSMDDIIAKKINELGIELIKLGIYDEFNEEVSTKIKESNITFDEWVNKMFPQRGTKTSFKDIMMK